MAETVQNGTSISQVIGGKLHLRVRRQEQRLTN